MSLIRRPVFWSIIFAAGLALAVGGGSPMHLGESQGDNPADEVAEGLPIALQYDEVVMVTADPVGQSPPVLPDVDDTEIADTEILTMDTVADVGGPTEEELVDFEQTKSPRIFYHIVQPGDTLSTIAEKFGIGQDTILAANDLPNANMLRVGERLTILSVDGALHRVQRGESLWQIARMYGVDLDEIIELNTIADPNRVMVADEIFIPGTRAAQIGKALRTEKLVDSNGRLLKAFSWPVTGRISSTYGPRWGSMHHGVDVAVPTGTPVRAAAAGRVSFAGWNGGYGYLVTIDHGNRVETRYAHNSRIMVRVGQHVQRGDLVAYSGNTGRSTGPHVHFEIRQNGQSVDPMNYLK